VTGNLADCIDRATPERDALVVVGGDEPDEHWTFAQVIARVGAATATLRALPLPRQAPVAIQASNAAETLIAILAAGAAGLIACPVNPRLSPAAQAELIGEAGAALTIGETAFGSGQGAIPHLTTTDLMAQGSPANPVPADPDSIAMLLFTSGSTGHPKGVPITHAGWLWGLACFDHLRAGAADTRSLVAAPMHHMNALGSLLVNLSIGAASVLMRRWRPAEAAAVIDRHAVTEFTGVPTMLAQLLDGTHRLAGGSVNAISIGSAPLGEPLRRAIHAAFPGAVLDNGYGTTETGIVAFAPHPDGLPTPPLALGVPHPAVAWRLDGPEPDRGVLWLRTGMTTPGYWRRPDLTAERFEDGWFRTNDLMRRDAQGFFTFEGRTDDMFVCGGNNLYPGPIEAVVETLPGVAQAVVVPVPDAALGAIPVAVIVARGTPPALAQVQAAVRDAIAPYAAPRRLVLVGAMPLAGTAKIDRRAAAVIAERAPETER
jgi:acyl-CoA synthetase (AMP-forming)/AMP-acid ligase II